MFLGRIQTKETLVLREERRRRYSRSLRSQAKPPRENANEGGKEQRETGRSGEEQEGGR